MFVLVDFLTLKEFAYEKYLACNIFHFLFSSIEL